jgi:hypothetical protein
MLTTRIPSPHHHHTLQKEQRKRRRFLMVQCQQPKVCISKHSHYRIKYKDKRPPTREWHPHCTPPCAGQSLNIRKCYDDYTHTLTATMSLLRHPEWIQMFSWPGPCQKLPWCEDLHSRIIFSFSTLTPHTTRVIHSTDATLNRREGRRDA